jgi:hypothetical protein
MARSANGGKKGRQGGSATTDLPTNRWQATGIHPSNRRSLCLSLLSQRGAYRKTLRMSPGRCPVPQVQPARATCSPEPARCRQSRGIGNDPAFPRKPVLAAYQLAAGGQNARSHSRNSHGRSSGPPVEKRSPMGRYAVRTHLSPLLIQSAPTGPGKTRLEFITADRAESAHLAVTALIQRWRFDPDMFVVGCKPGRFTRPVGSTAQYAVLPGERRLPGTVLPECDVSRAPAVPAASQSPLLPQQAQSDECKQRPDASSRRGLCQRERWSRLLSGSNEREAVLAPDKESD